MKPLLSLILLSLLGGCALFDDDSATSSKVAKPSEIPLASYRDLNVATGLEGITITGYDLMARTPVDSGLMDYTFRAIVVSDATTVSHATEGTVQLQDERFELTDNHAIFGDLYPGATQRSHTGFTVRGGAQNDVVLDKLNWQLNHNPVTVIGQQPFPAEVMKRFEELYRAGEFLPQFVLGDVNGDGVANQQDANLLGRYLEQPDTTPVSCLAAGDLTGDGQISSQDIDAFGHLMDGKMWFAGTDIPIDGPLLYTQPAMPCELRGLFFAATPAVSAGNTASLFFLNPAINTRHVSIEVLSGNVTLAANQLSYGIDVLTHAAMGVGETVVLKLVVPTMGSYLYAFPIQAQVTTLALKGGDDDGDDPTDTPPPAIYGEEDEADECPVKDNGCEALLIDFFRYGAFYDLDMRTHELIEPQLTALGCNVTAVYPRYLRAPIFGSLFTGGGSQNTYINNTNIRTLEGIGQAIDRHARLLSQKRALGIQMVLGHGDRIGWGVSFSAPSGQTYSDNPTVSRTSLHQRVYDAEFSDDEYKVCGNVALDYSCQSGYTAINIQTLNNTGSASRTPATSTNHTLHAGYDMDVGRGEALIGDDDGSVREGVLSDQVEKVSAALEAEKTAREKENHAPPRYKRLRNRLQDYAKSYLSEYMYYVDGGFEDDDYDHREKLR
ncbi:dockerin type I repeat-containing protein [Aestuariibacter halophilus]|uniref:Dockerin type I repeat-containing protein n=1 Tax=Fluctibacter halophilus TaxID=226011 RepID=A0ABS8GAJ3_9ALTE|nr:dockerin type I repeat-containing protein [Aestuariibacter halophilus]MCC2616830.1 dockerin type I repeat-containing protein [Aestuariibacter halophilus]